MLWIVRLLVIVVILCGGISALIQSLPRSEIGCMPVCWHDLHLGSSYARLDDYFASQEILTNVRQNGRYEWTQSGGDYTFLLNGDGRLMRIDAGWVNPEDRPTLGHALLWFGAPDRVHVESEVVANVRRLTVVLTYVADEQITVLSLRRVSNDPSQFGEMRIHPDDSILRISRYEGNPQTVNRLMDDVWRGFARYPVTRVCC